MYWLVIRMIDPRLVTFLDQRLISHEIWGNGMAVYRILVRARTPRINIGVAQVTSTNVV
jgi:hypothetical protein